MTNLYVLRARRSRYDRLSMTAAVIWILLNLANTSGFVKLPTRPLELLR